MDHVMYVYIFHFQHIFSQILKTIRFVCVKYIFLFLPREQERKEEQTISILTITTFSYLESESKISRKKSELII